MNQKFINFAGQMSQATTTTEQCRLSFRFRLKLSLNELLFSFKCYNKSKVNLEVTWTTSEHRIIRHRHFSTIIVVQQHDSTVIHRSENFFQFVVILLSLSVVPSDSFFILSACQFTLSSLSSTSLSVGWYFSTPRGFSVPKIFHQRLCSRFLQLDCVS